MATVPSDYAAWLKSPALYVVGNVPGVVARWGDMAQDSELISPLAGVAAAQAEAMAQVAFLAGPIARDKVTVKGQRNDLVGRLIAVAGDRLGYDATPSVFVVGAEEQEDGTTTLSVLRRLNA